MKQVQISGTDTRTLSGQKAGLGMKKIMGSVASGAAAFALCAISAQAAAFSIGEVEGKIENKFSVGMLIRTESASPELVGIANGGANFSTNSDDGNLSSPDGGDLISMPIKLTNDFSLDWRNYGIFARTSVAFDLRQHDRDYFNPNDYADDGSREATTAELDRKNEAVRREVGKYADLLDLYVYGVNENVFGRTLAWRIGKQVINWGESTLVQNGINSILSANANRARSSGFEVEEVIIPSSNIWISYDLIDNVNLEAFYQLNWEKSIPDAAGTFYSTNDFVGIGGTRANLGFGRANENTPPTAISGNPTVPFGSSVPRAPDNEARDSDQFGMALKFYVPELNDSDIGLYSAQFHSRLPLISGISRSTLISGSDTARYLVEYPEYIKVHGISLSTLGPWGTAFNGEYSLKQDQPLQLDDVEILLAGLGSPNQITGPATGVSLGNQYIRGWRRHNVSQVDMALTKVVGSVPMIRASQMVFLAEVAGMHVNGLPDPSVLRYEGPNTPLPGSAAVAMSQGIPQETGQFATASSWGYKLIARATYTNVLNLFTVEPTLRFDHDVNGMSPTPIGTFIEGRKLARLSVGVDYLSLMRMDVGYTTYFGGGKQNNLSDRDYVEATFKVAF